MKGKSSNDKNLFVNRLLAFIFDIFLVSIIASFISMPFLDYDSIDNLTENASQVLIDYSEGNMNEETYISSAGSILYRLAKKQGPLTLTVIFLNILYFVVFQFYNKGQTVGKSLLKIKIVSNDSKNLTMDNYVYRALLINSILADMIVFAFMVFLSQELWLNSVVIFVVINYMILFICGLMVILNKDGRGLHDLVGNTKVVQYRK